MSDLSSRILTALDEAVAQEVGARLRQAAQNVPSGGSAPTFTQAVRAESAAIEDAPRPGKQDIRRCRCWP